MRLFKTIQNFVFVLSSVYCVNAFTAENTNPLVGKTLSISEQSPLVRISREMRFPDLAHVKLKVTCHYSEMALGPDLSVELDGNVLVRNNSIEYLDHKVRTLHSLDGKYVCNGLIRKSVNPYVLLSESQVLIGEEIWTLK